MINKLLYFLLVNIFISICFSTERIVTVGGSITEIVFSLNQGHRVIAVDQSSTIPNHVTKLPQVGYIRSISAEGILSIEPTKILTTSDIGPPNIVDQIKSTNVNLHVYNSPKSFEDIISLVKSIGKDLEVPKEAEELISNMNKSLKGIEKIVSKRDTNPRIAFFMGMGGASTLSSFNAAGGGTRADYLIEFIGGKNIFKTSFKRYSKVDIETLIDYNPEVILIASMELNDGLINNIMSDKSLMHIDAVSKKHVYIIDLGYNLTFGSNFINAATELIQLIGY